MHKACRTFSYYILIPALAVLLLAAAPARGQFSDFGQTPEHSKKKSKHAGQSTVPEGPKPSIPPSFTIPVDTLGFAPPGPIYTGQRVTMASLDFLDEDHILFTFRVPGLLKRDPNYASDEDSGERQIRALVLSLPSGNIVSEDLWTLHDHERYLWTLGNGRFLLRNGNELSEGDLTLKLRPTLRFPGPVSSLYLDPQAKFLATNSHEPAQKTQTAPSATNAVVNPAQKTQFDDITTQTGDELAPNGLKQAEQPTPEENIIRILNHDSGKVLLFGRTASPVRLAINSTGYLQPLRQLGRSWALQLYHFSGGQNRITFVDSNCLPWLDFISDTEIMATLCDTADSTRLLALTTDGRELWHTNSPSGTIWPQIARSLNGLRLARESLAVNHPVNASAPLDPEDIKAQRITVYDAATGHVVLTAYASPILSEGGNLALSPSGRRAAILNNGQIQVWNLDLPPPLPARTAP